jgi:hypothetical protein
MSSGNSGGRELTYAEAIYEATHQEMERDDSVFVYGLGVDDVKGMYGTTADLHNLFGAERNFDTPLSEDAMTGLGIGASRDAPDPRASAHGLSHALHEPARQHRREVLLYVRGPGVRTDGRARDHRSKLGSGRTAQPVAVFLFRPRSWAKGRDTDHAT